MKKSQTSRRSFLAASGAVAGAPFILPSHIWAAKTKPNDRLVMGFVGMGKQNGGLLNNFIHHDVQVVAVAEVDKNRREAAQKKVNDFYTAKPDKGTADCVATTRFEEITERDDIDAVCIATPDHWHAIVTLSALNHKKDVYCEKPLTHNIHEAIEVMKAVDANGRVLQTGSMQRSMKEFRVASALVRNGVIGKVDRVLVNFGDPGRPCDLPEEAMEPGLDWDRWLGPAPERPYNSVLSPRGVHNHFPSWRNYREYGGGMVTDWGAHHIDIAHWGLGMDESGPVKALPPAKPGDKRGASLEFAGGVTVTHGGGMGVHFFGEKGEVEVTRGRFRFELGGEEIAKFTRREDGGSLGSALVKAEREHLADAKVELYQSKHHIGDFLEAVGKRSKPITHEGVGGRSAISCHLMNLAYYHHETVGWDPAALAFADGGGKPEWLTRDYRAPWKV